MKNKKKLSNAILLAAICSLFVIGTVFAGNGINHSNFENTLGLSSYGGWGKTRVITPGTAYRPQVKYELQNSAGSTISTAADWGSYGASYAYAYCRNTTGASPTRLWVTHIQWVNATQYVYYNTLP